MSIEMVIGMAATLAVVELLVILFKLGDIHKVLAKNVSNSRNDNGNDAHNEDDAKP